MIKYLKKLVREGKLLFLLWSLYLLSPLVDVANYTIKYNFIHVNNFAVYIMWGVRNFYIPVILTIIVFILIDWHKEIFIRKKINENYIFTIQFIIITAVIDFVIVKSLLALESLKYPNYLYSETGIKVISLNSISIINVAVILICLYFYKILNEIHKKIYQFQNFSLNNFKIILSCVAFVVVFLFSSYPFFNIITVLGETKQDYERRLGPSYKYINAIENTTPVNAKIIHPPQGQEWPLVGNEPLIRYFLFPRTLISGGIVVDKSVEVIVGEAYFFKIPRTKDQIEWPIINTREKEVVFDTVNSVGYSVISKTTEYNGIEIYKIKF